jgi:tRNA-(ms[2]io[6]A)-hydroxylase
VNYPCLRSSTTVAWVHGVQEKPLELLSDHAHNELKSASTAQAWLLKSPGNTRLVLELSKVAAEEMEHFERVIQLLYGRGGALLPVDNNAYAEALLSGSAKTRRSPFLDRMIVAALIETRSCERFELLAEHLADEELGRLYAGLIPSETGHRKLFIDLACEAFPGAATEDRIEELFDLEAEVIGDLPFGYRMHSGCP